MKSINWQFILFAFCCKRYIRVYLFHFIKFTVVGIQAACAEVIANGRLELSEFSSLNFIAWVVSSPGICAQLIWTIRWFRRWNPSVSFTFAIQAIHIQSTHTHSHNSFLLSHVIDSIEMNDARHSIRFTLLSSDEMWCPFSPFLWNQTEWFIYCSTLYNESVSAPILAEQQEALFDGPRPIAHPEWRQLRLLLNCKNKNRMRIAEYTNVNFKIHVILFTTNQLCGTHLTFMLHSFVHWIYNLKLQKRKGMTSVTVKCFTQVQHDSLVIWKQ